MFRAGAAFAMAEGARVQPRQSWYADVDREAKKEIADYFIADETALGLATISVVRDSRTIASGTLQIGRVAPYVCSP